MRVFLFMVKSLENEIWKDVPGYKSLYQVSNLGRVKSLATLRKRKTGDYMVKESLRILDLNQGYHRVNLYLNKKPKFFGVHQLMAMAFWGHVPCGQELVVDHKNNIRNDNRLENLQLITSRKNNVKDRKNGTSKYPGVYWHKGNKRWMSRIFFDKKTHYLGNFKDEEKAYSAYLNKLKEISK